MLLDLARALVNKQHLAATLDVDGVNADVDRVLLMDPRHFSLIIFQFLFFQNCLFRKWVILSDLNLDLVTFLAHLKIWKYIFSLTYAFLFFLWNSKTYMCCWMLINFVFNRKFFLFMIFYFCSLERVHWLHQLGGDNGTFWGFVYQNIRRVPIAASRQVEYFLFFDVSHLKKRSWYYKEIIVRSSKLEVLHCQF